MDSILDGYELHSAYPEPSEVAAKLACVNLSSESRAWLEGQGVAETAMAGLAECRSGLVLKPGPKFEFEINLTDDSYDVGAATAVHLPITHEGRMVDLVRFTRERPRAFLQHGGRVCRAASWLGAPVATAFDDEGWPIPTPVWKTPLAWLRAGCVGLCYLRNSWPDHRLGPLRSLPAVLAEDAEHAFFLDKTVWRDGDESPERPQHWARIPEGSGKAIVRPRS